MREIKFRAWDTVDKKMKLPTLLRLNRDLPYTDDNNNGKVFQMQCNGQENIEYFNGRIILMQYTDLKDKNNKEIYEGDVLHCDGFWNLYAVWDEENARFAFLCADWVVTQGHPIQPSISSYCIIGNIYENHELLGANR
jgi:uncharacterized phage protein (TIGR01671 family)